MNIATKTTAPLKVFCSYSHQDEKALKTLRKHLSSLRLSGLIEDWHDRDIPSGGDWNAEILNNLDAADLILLLVSADLVHSEYCMQKETIRALQWHQAGKATVIPVFFRECVITGLPFESIQGTPRDVKWISQQSFADKAWTEVTQAVEVAALHRLGVSAWPDNAAPVDPWTIPIGLEKRASHRAVLSTDSEKIQTAFGSGHASPSSQSGHAYVASHGDKGSSNFVRTGLLALVFLVVVFGTAWFSWNQWFNEQSPVPIVEQKMVTRENDARLGVAKAYLEQGEYKKAKDTCSKAPDSPFKAECLVLTGLALREVDDSKLYLAEVEAINSAFSEVLLGEFRLADFDGETNPSSLELAERHFAKALQKNADLASVYFGRAQIQHFQGNAKASLSLYRQALSMAPDNGRFALNAATAMADAGQLELAEQQLRKILTINSEVLLAHAELIEALVNQEKFVEAKKEARALQTLLILRGDQVICEPVNTAEWVVFQKGLPAFMSSWASAGKDSWEEKHLYLNYIIGLAGIPLVELPAVDCDLRGH